MNKLKFLGLLAAAALTWTSCDKAEDVVIDSDLHLNITGLKDLGADHMYTAWIMAVGQPVRVGNFTANEVVLSFALLVLQTTGSKLETVDGSINLSQAQADWKRLQQQRVAPPLE